MAGETAKDRRRAARAAARVDEGSSAAAAPAPVASQGDPPDESASGRRVIKKAAAAAAAASSPAPSTTAAPSKKAARKEARKEARRAALEARPDHAELLAKWAEENKCRPEIQTTKKAKRKRKDLEAVEEEEDAAAAANKKKAKKTKGLKERRAAKKRRVSEGPSAVEAGAPTTTEDDEDEDRQDEEEKEEKEVGEFDGEKKKKVTSKERRALKREAEREAARLEAARKEKQDRGAPLVAFVGQLSYSVTAARLRSFLVEEHKLTGIDSVRLLTDSAGRSKGMAFVECATAEALFACIALHHADLDGRRINVERSAGGGREKRSKKLAELRTEQSKAVEDLTNRVVDEYLADGRLRPGEVDDGVRKLLARRSGRIATAALDEYCGLEGRDDFHNPSAYLTTIVCRISAEGVPDIVAPDPATTARGDHHQHKFTAHKNPAIHDVKRAHHHVDDHRNPAAYSLKRSVHHQDDDGGDAPRGKPRPSNKASFTKTRSDNGTSKPAAKHKGTNNNYTEGAKHDLAEIFPALR